MRLFVGIGLADRLGDARNRDFPGFKWVPPGNLHLTLKFLGDVPETGVEPLIGALESIAGNFAPFTLRASGWGAFPSRARAQVVWAGFADEPAGAAAKLAASVDEACARLGHAREKRAFAPHLTVARCKKASKAEAMLAFLGAVELGNFEVHGIQLFRSETLPTGARYSVLGEFRLSGH